MHLSIQKTLFNTWSGYTMFKKPASTICSFYKFSSSNITSKIKLEESCSLA